MNPWLTLLLCPWVMAGRLLTGTPRREALTLPETLPPLAHPLTRFVAIAVMAFVLGWREFSREQTPGEAVFLSVCGVVLYLLYLHLAAWWTARMVNRGEDTARVRGVLHRSVWLALWALLGPVGAVGLVMTWLYRYQALRDTLDLEHGDAVIALVWLLLLPVLPTGLLFFVGRLYHMGVTQ